MTVVLVTGGLGSIGCRLVRALASAGQNIRILDRAAPERVAPGVEVAQVDLTDRAAVARAMSGVGTIFHLAGLVHLVDPRGEKAREYERVNVDGTRNLVRAARAAEVERVVLFSTINVYGPTREGEVHNEDSPLRPDSRYAESKAAAEEMALGVVPTVVLRLAAVYGPAMKGNYARLLHAIRRRNFAMLGDGRNRRTLVHVDDVCAAAQLAAAHPIAVGRVYNVTDGQIHTVADIIAGISGALGRRPPSIRVPLALVRLATGAAESGARAVGLRAPAWSAMVDKYIEDIAVDGGRIQREVGFRPAYDLDRGWRETVAEMQQAGRL